MTLTADETAKPGTDAEKKPRSRKKLPIVIVVLLLGGGGYWFTRPPEDAAAKPGEVMTLEPVMLNLAEGKYLKVGLALQLIEGIKEVDGAEALDAMIERFSGLPESRVNDLKGRRKLQSDLTTEIRELYPEEVIDTYFVLFVTQ